MPLISTIHLVRCRFAISSTVQTFKPSARLSALSSASLQSLVSDSLITLEWPAICRQLISFTSTSMAQSLAARASIPLGVSQEESQKLLDQTGAAVEAISDFGHLDLSRVEDITAIVDSAVSGQLLTIRELCAVQSSLSAAREAYELLVSNNGDDTERYSPLIEILEKCNFQTELEEKIAFCIDSNFSLILSRASEELENIRSERKKNMENLDQMLRSVSATIFQEGGIDRPVVTKRRSRLCVGVKASHKFLIPGGVVLDVSSSGATYFMEPLTAIELNNREVLLRDSERNEEVAILSLLTSEIAERSKELKSLLHRIVDIDLAFARAAHAHWVGGTCPIFSSKEDEMGRHLSIDIESICHPVLLHDFDNAVSKREKPVPISIKVEYGTKIVVISGPNTGGKTAAMKTLGIASLMSKGGMYLPANPNPKLPWFDVVLADIGDHQSLEQSLSTFSGHISKICKILEVASENSLVLIDEICSGTDPSEGVALSTSILHYLKSRVNLAVVTTHYADLTRLKEKDLQFENAAMEFSLQTLLPTYQILWGSAGKSNALTIAQSLDFDDQIIQRARMWVDKLSPELQQERKGFLFQSLLSERNRLESEAEKVSSLHKDVMQLYKEINAEAKDLEIREKALMTRESQTVEQTIEKAKSKIHNIVRDFEKDLQFTSSDNVNSLLKKANFAIESIIEANKPRDYPPSTEPTATSSTLKPGQQVLVKSLRDKVATIVKTLDGEDILVQHGLVRVRVKKSDIRAAETNTEDVQISPKTQQFPVETNQDPVETNQDQEIPYRVKTSKNTVDLRGMRTEEASYHLEMDICARESDSIIYVVHGVGTGVVKQRVLEILRKHPRVAKYEQESTLNFGCTVAYII